MYAHMWVHTWAHKCIEKGNHHCSNKWFPCCFVVYKPSGHVPCRKPCYLLIPKNFPKACHFLFFPACAYGFGFHRDLYLALKPMLLFFSCKLAILLLLYESTWLTMSHADTQAWSVSVNLKLVEFYSLLIQHSFLFSQILQKILICSFSI